MLTPDRPHCRPPCRRSASRRPDLAETTPSADSSRRRLRARTFAWVLVFAAAVAWVQPPAAWAQEGGEVEIRDRIEELVRQLEQRFDLSPEGDGYVLEPEDARDDFAVVEVRPGTGGTGGVSIDGVPVDREDLRRFVDADAQSILDLADLVAALAEAGETGADASEEERGDRAERWDRSGNDVQVSFGSDLVVEEWERVDEVVLVGGPLEVRGRVDGQATVILGSAVVSGRIDGDLTVVGGSIHLQSGAQVEGDVVVVGGGLRREDGARVDGEVVQVGVGEGIEVGGTRIETGDWGWDWPEVDPFGFAAWDLVSRIFRTILVAIVMVFLVLVAPIRVSRIAERARVEPWKCGLVGLVTEVLFFPLLGLVTILLLVSIVGIPLLVVVPPLMVLLLVFFFF
ncbi:MAG: hypothetical protein MI919_17345, partial [Holophagales bacterium]|nr:hypothetical protein [Holophagales bacterium]